MGDKGEGNWNYYNFYGGGYYYKFIGLCPEFDNGEFKIFASSHNRGDRDGGELGDIAKHEVLRLAAEFEERKWRFPNIYGILTE